MRQLLFGFLEFHPSDTLFRKKYHRGDDDNAW